MDDVVVDPNDLLKQFDPVSRTQRSLFAEFERQRCRLVHLLRWYDHQQTARGTELRRQFEYLHKETRRQIYQRSKMTIKERARLKHLLDQDENSLPSIHSQTQFQSKNPIDERKRHVYGCLLPQFKAPLEKSFDHWLQHSLLEQSEYEKRLERQRKLISKYAQSPLEQRNRMNSTLRKCLDQLVECDSDGYDHFLRTSESNRNAQILAQQNNKEETENPFP
ncbi:unnamed protein product [Adineta ricciae]|uniref:Uncharacterized protein n=1 Tax=Adineta ricciae TaxID=249248 RepID=A0A815ZA87_ADIRI|nr:unnamed protein product [Adineta ricciae]